MEYIVLIIAITIVVLVVILTPSREPLRRLVVLLALVCFLLLPR